MRRIRGNYSFYLHTLNKPVEFCIRLDKEATLEIQSRGHFFEFALTSNAQQDDVFWSWIMNSEDGLAFMLDLPIYSSWTNTFEEVPSPASDDIIDSQIDFELIFHTMKHDQTAGHYVDIEIPKKISLSTSEIADFINKLESSDLLNRAVGYYLKSIDEPEFFLASLYNAYELIRNTGAVSKTAAKKFTRLANDTSILGSRHTEKQVSGFRSLSSDERKSCQELIRNGIFRFARSLK